jgi:hypothetical protein
MTSQAGCPELCPAEEVKSLMESERPWNAGVGDQRSSDTPISARVLSSANNKIPSKARRKDF